MRKIVCSDTLQNGYVYVLSEPMGKNFHEDFKPDLTPSQMLALGVFGGHYFEGQHDEYPPEWFERSRLSDVHDSHMNYFDIDASQTREEWGRKGWIYPDDPRGWFQWYCRYYMGRRLSEEDVRQIKRWKAISRHAGQIRAHCRAGDELCRPRQRQALLHWAYDSRDI